MPGYRRVAAHDELRSKTMDLAAPAAELSAPDPRLVMKKRLCDEMDALRGILKKAELVVRKPADKGRAAPRRGKDGRFSAAEAQSEKDGRFLAAEAPCPERTKVMPAVEIIEPPPQIPKADPIPCAKKRRTTPPMEIIEPRMSKDEMFSLVTRLSSLSSNMPARIVEFLNKECTGHADEKDGEIEIDLGSMKRSAMFELQKLLDEFAEEEKRRQQKEKSMNACRSISCSSPRELEEGEFIEDGGIIKEGDFIKDCGATAETCVGDASPVVATPETAKSPSNSSSSGSSCSDSSNSDSSDSDSDDECVISNVAPAVLPITKADASAIAMPAKGLCSPPRILEDGEMTEKEVIDICGDASPIATEKFVETAKTPSSNSSSSSSSGSSTGSSGSSGSSCSDSSDSNSSDSDSDDECVTSSPAPVVLPKTNASPMAMPHKILSPIAETRNSRRSSNSSLLADGQCVRSRPAPAVRPEQSKPQPAAQGTVRHFCAMGFAKKRELERQRAYEKLEEMERNAKAKPIFDWIHPSHLRQLGITTAVEYAVSSERRFPPGRGCPVQSVLGLFLKAEKQTTGMVRWQRSH